MYLILNIQQQKLINILVAEIVWMFAILRFNHRSFYLTWLCSRGQSHWFCHRHNQLGKIDQIFFFFKCEKILFFLIMKTFENLEMTIKCNWKFEKKKKKQIKSYINHYPLDVYFIARFHFYFIFICLHLIYHSMCEYDWFCVDDVFRLKLVFFLFCSP